METVANNVLNIDLNTAQLPGIPEPTDAEKAALVQKLMAESKAKEETALARFDTNIGFKLEGQVIGQSTKRTVSKAGAVTVGVKSKKELAAISGLKGGELDAFIRMRKDEVKDKTCQLATRIAGDANWTGAGVTMSGKGNKVTLSFVKVEPVKVTLTAEPSDEVIAKTLGMTVEQVVAMKKAKAAAEAKAIADDKAAKELAAEEADRLAFHAKWEAAKAQMSEEEQQMAKEDPQADAEEERIAYEASKNGQVHAPAKP